MPAWGNATLLEATWTWMGLVGIGLSLRLWWLIERSIRRMLASGIGDIRVDVARTRARDQMGRAISFAGFVGIGLLAMLTPEAIRPANQTTDILGGALLVGVQARMLYDTIRDSIDRQRQVGQSVPDINVIEL